jgi:hypothetical protein
MVKGDSDWMSLAQAAARLGYKHAESLRHRLRQLRRRGELVDVGSPPDRYKTGNADSHHVVLFWVNSRTPLIRGDVRTSLLIPRRGRRPKKVNTPR